MGKMSGSVHSKLVLYISSHNTETTHWLDPRLMRQMHHDPLECAEDGNYVCTVMYHLFVYFPSLELPYGWEKVNDPIYGVYYIE